MRSDTTPAHAGQVTSLRARDERAARAIRIRMALLANEARRHEHERQACYHRADYHAAETDEALTFRSLLARDLAVIEARLAFAQRRQLNGAMA